MEIVAVRHSLLQLDAAGDDESDAVAIALVELLLSATNCFYRQRCLATAALRSTSAQLSSNVIDTALAAALGHDNALDSARFAAETRPEAEVKDRHAAHCVPTKSPEKAARSTSPQAPRAADGKRPSRRRRKLHKAIKTALAIRSLGGTEPPAVALPEVQTVDAMFEQEFTEEDENPDIKEWREKCLKSLETKKPGFSKWIAIARAFNKTENRVSMETGVIAPPLENVVAEFAVSPKEIFIASTIYSAGFEWARRTENAVVDPLNCGKPATPIKTAITVGQHRRFCSTAAEKNHRRDVAI
ncbi:hypothetical protein PHYBOEH_010436 [Phytophthora boehmeriae]|uniref:Uncharacterized protein n=1 Tax=Phytophthora boehmeriae TaxID=109152 RepID=A0A8T1X0S8_9STRA|nr:hypothetical protein PHYBOEH_010436 [Phytophthora boehmeriae]